MTRRSSTRSRAAWWAVALVVALLAAWWWLDRPASDPAGAQPSAATASAGAGVGTVVWVADGDTLDVELAGVRTRVRLVNIDAPETAHNGVAAQCLADAARDELRGLAPIGSTLRLDTYGIDRFGRLVAAAWLPDGRSLNAELVRAGLAGPLVVDGQRPILDAVHVAQSEAASASAGLHGAASCSVPARLASARARLDGLGTLSAEQRRPAAVALKAEASELVGVLRADVRDSLVQGLTDAERQKADAAASTLLADASTTLARLGG